MKMKSLWRNPGQIYKQSFILLALPNRTIKAVNIEPDFYEIRYENERSTYTFCSPYSICLGITQL